MRTRDLLSTRYVSLADRCFNRRQIRRAGDNTYGARGSFPNQNKITHHLVCAPPAMSSDHDAHSGLIGHGNPRLCQVTQAHQTISVVMQGGRVCPESIHVYARRRRFGHSVVNAPKCIAQRLFLEACNGFQVLPLVILNRPLPWLREEVSCNPNHQGDNRSDQQALTHRPSVRERSAHRKGC